MGSNSTPVMVFFLFQCLQEFSSKVYVRTYITIVVVKGSAVFLVQVHQFLDGAPNMIFKFMMTTFIHYNSDFIIGIRSSFFKLL